MSDNLIPISDEQAKLGQELVKAARELGGFFGRTLGNTVENLIGYLFGDRLQLRRTENFIKHLIKTEQRLRAWGVDHPQQASLSIALPILQAAADEEREELVDLWARLLANAMDPKLNSVRYEFIDAVKNMNPMDARMLQYLYQAKVNGIRVGGGGIEQAAQQLGTRQDDAEVFVRHLHALGFVDNLPHDQNVWFPNARLREFMRACYPEIGL